MNMKEETTLQDLSYKFIQELIKFAHGKNTEEIFHFVSINLERIFGATATMYLYKKTNQNEVKVKNSKGFSHEYIKHFQNNPPLELLNSIEKSAGSIYIDFEKEPEKASLYKFEYEDIKELYIAPIRISRDFLLVAIICTVKSFKNLGLDKHAAFDTLFAILEFITNSNSCAELLRESSYNIDIVSELYNFKYFHERLYQEIQRAIIEKGYLSIALLSLNHLNEFNSVFGHIAGDRSIRLIGDAVRKYIRNFDTAARYGNKVIIYFPNLNKTDIKNIIKNIILEIKTIFKNEFASDILSMNGGVAEFPSDGDNERIILDLAESRLTEAKRNSGWSVI